MSFLFARELLFGVSPPFVLHQVVLEALVVAEVARHQTFLVMLPLNVDLKAGHGRSGEVAVRALEVTMGSAHVGLEVDVGGRRVLTHLACVGPRMAGPQVVAQLALNNS